MALTLDFFVSRKLFKKANNNINSLEITWDTDYNCVCTFTTWNTDHHCVYIHWNIRQMFTNKKKKCFFKKSFKFKSSNGEKKKG